MSCDWDVKCLDCNSKCNIDNANHGVELMRILVEHAKEIGALGPLVEKAGGIGWDLELRNFDRHINVTWFAEHAAHRLAPVDEYGRLDNECGKTVRCSECGAVHDCTQERNHNGACK